DEPPGEIDEICGRSMIDIAGGRLRVRPEARPHLLLQRRRPRLEAVDRVVGAPFHQLHAVQARRDTGQRNIADGDPAAASAPLLPEWLSLHELARVTPIEVVGAGAELDEAVDA